VVATLLTRAAIVVAFLVLAGPGQAEILLGIHGHAERFSAQTGQRSQVRHVFMGWGQATGARLDRLIAQLAPIPMVAIKTGRPETITPRQIAMGAGDAFLIDLNRAIAAWAKPIYVRPLPEMNGHWNAYCAFTREGRPKGPTHSTEAFRKAFARVYLLVKGGTAAELSAALQRLGLPGVEQDLALNPQARVIWNPQGYGSPDLPGNSAQAYFPGDRFVDVVGNDLYYINGKAEWAAADVLYDAHPGKPYAFPEWGLWGLDAPGFIRDMREFVRTHKRVELISWFQAKPGSIFDLSTKPQSRKAYRELITPLG
jgi:hypothetical protein